MKYPAAAWRPVKNASTTASWGRGRLTAHDGLILHVQAGNNSPYGWFNNPASQASSTWWISKTGKVEQYVDTDYRAWAQGAGNSTYNSVETEGRPGEPLSAAQVKALAQLFAWGHVNLGWRALLADKPGDLGLGWHGMGGAAWGGHDGCPGELRKAQRDDVLALLKAPAPKPQPTPAPTPAPPVTVQSIPPKVPPMTLLLYANRASAPDKDAADAWCSVTGRGASTCDLELAKAQAAAGARVVAVGGPACQDLAGVPGVIQVNGSTAKDTAQQLLANVTP